MKKAQHQAGIEPATPLLRGVGSKAVLQPLPKVLTETIHSSCIYRINFNLLFNFLELPEIFSSSPTFIFLDRKPRSVLKPPKTYD